MNEELTLKDLIIIILKRWRMMIIFALMFTILLGGYKILSGFKTLPAEKALAEQKAAYDVSVLEYEQNKADLESQIVQLEAKLKRAEEYNSQSVLMKTDPYNLEVFKLSICVNVDPQITNFDIAGQKTLGLVELKSTLIDNILNRYLVIADSMSLSKILSGTEYGTIKDRYLQEMVSVYKSAEGVITIKVINGENFNGTVIAHKIYDYLKGNRLNVIDTIGDHELVILNESTAAIFDQQLLDDQIKNQQYPFQITKNITEASQEVSNLVEPDQPDYITKASVIKSGIKYGILGLIAGLCVGAFVAVLSVTLDGRIRTAEQLQNQFKIRYLGSMEQRRSYKGLDAFARRLAGESINPNGAANINVITANLFDREIMPQTVLLTGTLEEEKLKNTAGKLADLLKTKGADLLCGSYILNDADTIEKLKQADCVILVESIKRSTASEVTREINRIKESGKDIAGYILI